MELRASCEQFLADLHAKLMASDEDDDNYKGAIHEHLDHSLVAHNRVQKYRLSKCLPLN